MVARIPTVVGELDPPLQPERLAVLCCRWNRNRLLEIQVFGAAIVGDLVRPGRQQHFFAVGAVNLGVEEKVRGQPPRLRRIDAAAVVADDELTGGGLAVVVEHRQLHPHGRLALKQDRHFIAEAGVLRPLADVEPDRRLALALVAAVERHHAVFERQARQLGYQRLLVERQDVQPAIGYVLGPHGRPRCGAVRRAGVERLCVGAGRLERGGYATFVVNFHEEYPPALLDQLRFRRTAGDLHAALGVDVHAGEAAGVEHLLNRRDCLLAVHVAHCLFQRRLLGSRQRLAHEVERVGHALGLLFQRLRLHTRNQRQLVRRGPRSPACEQHCNHHSAEHAAPPTDFRDQRTRYLEPAR